MLTSVDTFNKAVTDLSVSYEFAGDIFNNARKLFPCIRPSP